MYIPEHFKLTEPASIQEVMRNHSFATLVSGTTSNLIASHVPLLWSDDGSGYGCLRGLVARDNPQWEGFDMNTPVLASFNGHHAYISPTWDNIPPAVPTWNYVAVHAYGTPQIVESPTSVAILLKQMITTFDSNPDRAWPNSKHQDEMVQEMIPNIVAFEIPISRVEAKAKLSQNRPPDDRINIIEALQGSNDNNSRDLGAYMEKFWKGT